MKEYLRYEFDNADIARELQKVGITGVPVFKRAWENECRRLIKEKVFKSYTEVKEFHFKIFCVANVGSWLLLPFRALLKMPFVAVFVAVYVMGLIALWAIHIISWVLYGECPIRTLERVAQEANTSG